MSIGLHTPGLRDEAVSQDRTGDLSSSVEAGAASDRDLRSMRFTFGAEYRLRGPVRRDGTSGRHGFEKSHRAWNLFAVDVRRAEADDALCDQARGLRTAVALLRARGGQEHA